MHIPDGYLGPVDQRGFLRVDASGLGNLIPVVKKTLKARQAPLLAISAAFSFVIMMFNLPIPGGSSGHATGGVPGGHTFRAVCRLHCHKPSRW